MLNIYINAIIYQLTTSSTMVFRTLHLTLYCKHSFLARAVAIGNCTLSTDPQNPNTRIPLSPQHFPQKHKPCKPTHSKISPSAYFYASSSQALCQLYHKLHRRRLVYPSSRRARLRRIAVVISVGGRFVRIVLRWGEEGFVSILVVGLVSCFLWEMRMWMFGYHVSRF